MKKLSNSVASVPAVHRSIQCRWTQRSASELVFFAATVISILWQFCTIVSGIFSSSVATFGILALWYASALWYMIDVKKLGGMVLMLLPGIAMFVLTLFQFLLSGEQIDLDGYWSPFKPVYLTYTMCHGIAFGCAVNSLRNELKIKLINYTMIILTVSALPSYYYVSIFSDAVRVGVSSLGMSGLGLIGYSYIYSVIPLLGLMIVALKFGKCKGVSKMLIAICLIVNLGIILLSNFATALVITAATVFIGLVFTKRTTFFRFMLFACVVAGIVLLLRNQIGDLILKVAEADIFSETMKFRFHTIVNLLTGEDVSGSFITRLNLMGGSWESFLQYPIFGMPYGQINEDTLGFHETWLSLLAYSGVVGLFLTVLSFYVFFKRIVAKQGNSIFKNTYALMVLVVFGMSFLNPLIAKSNLMVLLAIMPLFSIMFAEERGNKEKCTRSTR